MRLDRYLAECGYGTRSAVKELVRSGAVSVGSAVVKDPGLNISADDEVCVNGVSLKDRTPSGTHWFMLNKPRGMVCANSDDRYPTVLELFEKERIRGLFTVGRLDVDTEGLLLVSDDGELGHYLLSPSRKVKKTYLADISGTLDPDAAERFAEGIAFKDFTSAPAGLEILAPEGSREWTPDGSRALITVSEGKFHEVKRLVAAVGGEVTALKRVAFGPLKLDEALGPGEYRVLTADEIRLLKAAVGKD